MSTSTTIPYSPCIEGYTHSYRATKSFLIKCIHCGHTLGNPEILKEIAQESVLLNKANFERDFERIFK